LIADGKTRELILTENLDLYVSEYFFTELQNNLDDVEDKTGLERSELELLVGLLFEQVNIVPREEFETELPAAREQVPDPDDAPFLALAVALDAGIWSDDSHLQEQDAAPIWKTHELVAELDG